MEGGAWENSRMDKTPEQTSKQGTLVDASHLPEDAAHEPMNNPTNLSPGVSETPQKDSEQLTHGQETYSGIRPEYVNQSPGEDPPAAGDTDPDSTKSATDTGQNGEVANDEKKKAFSYT
jgi:hypothetical protein